MKIFIGKKGLKNTWQNPFEEAIKCPKCGGKAKIMFSGIEDYPQDKGNFICDLHKTTGKKGGLWLHDGCAVAVYLCSSCFEATALVNQA